MEMTIEFPGGKRVDALWKGHRIQTDQPEKSGGTNSASAPFDLFLASIATCAGYYAHQFCHQRGLATDQMAVRMQVERDEERGRIGALRIEVDLPPDFPSKYREAILRAVDQCAVKRHIVEPPTIDVVLSDAG